MCKNLPVLNLPNEGYDLIVQTDASNEHWSTIRKIKEGKKLCKYCSVSFNKEERCYPTMLKEILAVIRGIKKFLIFLASKPFPIQIDCKGVLGFVKKFIKYASAKATPALIIMA